MFFNIVSFGTSPNKIVVYSKTNRADYFQPGLLLQVRNSTNNDGIYTVVSTSYNVNLKQQTVVVTESITAGAGSGTLNGSIYTLDFTDNAINASIITVPNEINVSTSLSLIGRGSALNTQHDALRQQNNLRLLENFASDTPQPNPVTGQRWYDTADSNLKVWDGATWGKLFEPGYTGIRFIDPQNSNSVVTLTGDEYNNLNVSGQPGVAVVPTLDTGVPTDSIFRVLNASGTEQLRVNQNGDVKVGGVFANENASVLNYSLGSMSVGSNSSNGNDFKSTGNVLLSGTLDVSSIAAGSLTVESTSTYLIGVNVNEVAYNLNSLQWNMGGLYSFTGVADPISPQSLVPKGWLDNTVLAASLEFDAKKFNNRSNMPISRVGGLNYDPLMILSIQPYNVYVSQIPVIIDGAVFNTAVKSIDLSVQFSTGSPPEYLNNTFYVYVDLVGNTADVLIENVKTPSTPTHVFIGIVTTGNTGITSIQVDKTTQYARLGLALSSTPDSVVVSTANGRVSPSFLNKEIVTITSISNDIVLADENAHIQFDTSSATTYKILNDSSVELPVGAVVSLSRQGIGSVTVVADTGVTIDCAYATNTLRTQYSRAYAKKLAANHWLLYGDLN